MTALIAGVCAQGHAAVIIQDPSFFATIPHTYLDFESLPDGTTLADLTDQNGILISRDSFASQGVRFGADPVWARPGNLSAEMSAYHEALQLGGSPSHMLAGVGVFNFDVPVRSLGVFLMIQSSAPAADSTAFFRFFDTSGALVDFFVFDEQSIQGSIEFVGALGSPQFVHYGFFGGVFDTQIAKFDIGSVNDPLPSIGNLYFSAVPAPGAGTALVIAGSLALRRRR